MFLMPGSRMEGRKGRRGGGDILVALNVYSSTQTIQIPLGATRAKVWLWGANGAGGGLVACAIAPSGSGGGGLFKLLTGLLPGNTLAVTVPAAPAAGVNGGNATLASGTQIISTLTANGGVAGAGTVGTATGGDLNVSGQIGCAGAGSPGGLGGLGFGAGGKASTTTGTAGLAGTAGGCMIEWYS